MLISLLASLVVGGLVEKACDQKTVAAFKWTVRGKAYWASNQRRSDKAALCTLSIVGNQYEPTQTRQGLKTEDPSTCIGFYSVLTELTGH